MPMRSGLMTALYVCTSNRDEAECLAWSLVRADVRLALVDGSWAVRIAPDPHERIEALTLVVQRCLERLSIRNGHFLTEQEALCSGFIAGTSDRRRVGSGR